MNSNRKTIWIAAAGILVSVLWLIISFWYVSANFGWQNLTQSLPHELAVVILGIVVPIAEVNVVPCSDRITGDTVPSRSRIVSLRMPPARRVSTGGPARA